jgi:hypothetical protein
MPILTGENDFINLFAVNSLSVSNVPSSASTSFVFLQFDQLLNGNFFNITANNLIKILFINI